MMKLSRKIGAIGAVSLMLAVILAACGGEDPTATPRPAATPTPDAMMEDKAEPTPTPEAMMEATAEPAPDTGGSTGPAPTANASTSDRPHTRVAGPDPGFDAEGLLLAARRCSLMVGFNPGGGTDAQARFMSRAIGRSTYRVARVSSSPTGLRSSCSATSSGTRSQTDSRLQSRQRPASSDMFRKPGAEFDMREVHHDRCHVRQ